MSNSNGHRRPLLVSFTFGRHQSIQPMTAVGQQPTNIGEELSALSPTSTHLKKLNGGNIYVTIDVNDGEESCGNETELVAATNLDPAAHFSVVIALPKPGMSTLKVMRAFLWHTTASKPGEIGKRTLLCHASFSTEKLRHLPALSCLRCYVQSFQPEKPGLWAYIWRVPPPRPPFVLESSLMSSLRKGKFNPISSHFTFIKQGTSLMSQDATDPPVPDLLILENEEMATSGTPYSDLNQFPENSSDKLNIGNDNQQRYLISCEEEAFELGEISVSLPLMFMEKFCRSIGLLSLSWVERYRMERERQGFFDSVDDAMKAGYVFLRVLVLGGRNISPPLTEFAAEPEQPTTTYDFSSPMNSSESKSKKKIKQASKKFKNALKTVNQVAVNASRANVKSYIGQKKKKGDERKGNFFCAISYLGRCLGRTNTEYDTNDPEWGSNLKVKSCLHTSPRVSATAYGAATTNDGCTDFCMLIKPPTANDPSTSSIQISLYHEKYGISSGVNDTLVCKLDVPISLSPSDGPQWLFLPKCRAGELLVLATVENSGFAVVCPGIRQPQEKNNDFNFINAGKSDPDACSSSGEEDREEQEDGVYTCPEEEEEDSGLSFHPPEQLPPVDTPLQFCWDFAKMSLPPDVAAISPMALFSSMEYDVAYCQRFVSQISKEVNRLEHMISVARKNIMRGGSIRTTTSSLFRSSMEKKTWSKQFIPINLHAQVLSVDSSYSSCQHGFITAGAPTAHALGYERGGLLSMDKKLSELSRTLEHFLVEQGDRGGCVTNAGDKIQLVAQEFEELCLVTSIRRAIVTSQVLTIALAAVILKLKMNNNYTASTLVDLTLPIGFESLLSTRGKERGMLEDAVSAVRIIRTWKFRVLLDEKEHTCVTGIDMSSRIIFLSLKKRGGPCNSTTIMMKNSAVQRKSRAFDVTIEPILFTQGIDMVQTMANARSRNIQLKKTFDGLVPPQHKMMMQDLRAALRDEVEVVVGPIGRPGGIGRKNTSLLQQAERCIRALGGMRVTFCKSGKDRTAMSVTLEEAFLIQGIDEVDKGNELITKAIVNILRSKGIRIKIAEKNVGAPVYSFNAIQRKFIPDLYKAPPGTIQDVITSYKKRDSYIDK